VKADISGHDVRVVTVISNTVTSLTVAVFFKHFFDVRLFDELINNSKFRLFDEVINGSTQGIPSSDFL